MFLNQDEIVKKGILKNYDKNNFGDGSYNLSIDKIIDMSGRECPDFTLKPQGMVYVVFNEELKMPNDVIGFAHVKTSLTKIGIMATNIGIIDPSYNGYISTLLINFGKSDHKIQKGDLGMRVTFSNLKIPEKPLGVKHKNLLAEEYLKNIKKDTCYLDDRFLNLSKVEEEVETKVQKNVFTTIRNFISIFAVGSFLVAAYFQFKNSEEKDLDRAIKEYHSELSIIKNDNEKLNRLLLESNKRYNAIFDSINVLIKTKK